MTKAHEILVRLLRVDRKLDYRILQGNELTGHGILAKCLEDFPGTTIRA